MMEQQIENPFANVGPIVYGSGFIGRKEYLKAIESRVIPHHGQGGSMALVGMYHVGKSSLAYKALLECKAELQERKILPLLLSLGNYTQPESFFRELVTCCKRELEVLGWSDDDIWLSGEEALGRNLSWNEMFVALKEFLVSVRKKGIRVVYIVDEFDNARNLFKNDVARLQAIRDLGSFPDWQVNWVFLSRRRVTQIETQTNGISTLHGILIEPYLGLFDEQEDLPIYYERLAKAQVLLTPEDKRRIEWYCGRHPFLLSLLGYELAKIQAGKKEKISVDQAVKNAQSEFVHYYTNVTKRLKEDEKLKKLLQILFGPTYGLEQEDIDEMLGYGLIQLDSRQSFANRSQTAYMAFSRHFQDYLSRKVRDFDLWPLLTEIELKLRQVIGFKLEEQYGSQWHLKIEQKHTKLAEIIQRCRSRLPKRYNAGTPEIAQKLLEHCSLGEIFYFITYEWGLFKPLFGRNGHKEGYWLYCARTLLAVRNPLAHHNIDHIKKHEYLAAEQCCEEILDIIANASE